MPGKPVGVSMKFVKGAEKFGEVTALVRTIERDERFTITFQPNLLSTSNTPSRKRLIKLLQKRVPKLKVLFIIFVVVSSTLIDFVWGRRHSWRR